MVGGQVQLKLPASAEVGVDDPQHAVRLYNAATQAIEAGATRNFTTYTFVTPRTPLKFKVQQR